ncbi:MAG TPA: phosphatidylserine synthase [Methyloceanibacter sp.]|nr:phosphatidylserine synthase [Methyloceanibacter sp.]
MLLKELSVERRTVAQLAVVANLPDRLIVEALINLLRANWIEMRASQDGAFFAVTAVGKKRSSDTDLPAHVEMGEKWMSLCFDRVTGAWLRADDLKIVYARDLPNTARRLEAIYSTYSSTDAELRDLLYLSPLESLEPDEPRLRTPSRPYARFETHPEHIDGLPSYAPLKLRQAILEATGDGARKADEGIIGNKRDDAADFRDTITADDMFVGGEAQHALLQQCLESAKSTVVIHSCFVNPKTLKRLLPDLQAAAARKVRVELLWGLVRDPEIVGQPPSILEAQRLLGALPSEVRGFVTMSDRTSGSHAKLIVYDDAESGDWVSVISSCNFLSTNFDALDVSIRTRSPNLAKRLLSWLTTTQQPAAGGWSRQARRLNTAWGNATLRCFQRLETGEHELSLLVDADHYACLRTARDESQGMIVVACDLYGLAAETSVLVPMQVAAEKGVAVRLLYSRPSRILREEGRLPDEASLSKRGLGLKRVDELHGKFLLWDDRSLAVSSFNWLSTAVDGTRSRGAEFGLLIEGDGLRSALVEKLEQAVGFEEVLEAVREAPAIS